MAKTPLVTGASGALASAAVEHLLQGLGIGLQAIIAAERNPQRLPGLERQRVRVCHAPFNQPVNLEHAFEGAARMLLVNADAPTGRRTGQQLAATHAAARAGIWSSEAGAVRVPCVARDDYTRVAATVLASSRSDSATFDCTRIESLSTQEIAKLDSVVTGRPIHVDVLALLARHVQPVAADVPAPAADLLMPCEVNVALGRARPTSPMLSPNGTARGRGRCANSWFNTDTSWRVEPPHPSTERRTP